MLLPQIVVSFSIISVACVYLLVLGYVRGIRAEREDARFRFHVKTGVFAELILLVAIAFIGMGYSPYEQSRSMLAVVLYAFDAIGVIAALLLTWGCVWSLRTERNQTAR